MAINTAGQTRTGNAAPSGQANFKTGRIVLDGTSITAADYLLVELGFTPKYVCFENITDLAKAEWYEGMAQDTCLRTVAAGTRTLQTANKGIAITDKDGTQNSEGRCFTVSQNATLAIVAASKTLTWAAWG